jgi:hypothetical protein
MCHNLTSGNRTVDLFDVHARVVLDIDGGLKQTELRPGLRGIEGKYDMVSPTGRRSPLEPNEFTGVHKHGDPTRARPAGFQQTSDDGSGAHNPGSMSGGGAVGFGWRPTGYSI